MSHILHNRLLSNRFLYPLLRFNIKRIRIKALDFSLPGKFSFVLPLTGLS